MLDQSGLSPWLLALGCFLTLSLIAFVLLIIVRYPDPAIYRNSIAFCAIISFFLLFYFASGRGWYEDVLRLLDFDHDLKDVFNVLEPGRITVMVELVLAGVCAWVNLRLNDNLDISFSMTFAGMLLFFYFIQYVAVILCGDIMFRQLICLMNVVQKIRIDLLNADFYSNIANIMVRHVGLYIFGVCIISLSFIVFTEGELGPSEMMVAMMPWYLPGLIIITLYLIPFNHFRRRVHFVKHQELSSVASALSGNVHALNKTLLHDEPAPVSKINLLYYQDRIRAVREWPFTDRIRALVLFGILPPLTWVIAALIEIMIESSL